MLKPVKQIADVEIDTSDLNVYQLRRRVLEALGISASGVSLLFESFAFKRGVPNEADFVFDARALPNPHWEPASATLVRSRRGGARILRGRAEVGEFIDDVERFLKRWLPRFDPSERSYLTVAMGCTGGRHRSVYIAERLQERFRRCSAVKCCVSIANWHERVTVSVGVLLVTHEGIASCMMAAARRVISGDAAQGRRI